jgi:hypothetical protein
MNSSPAADHPTLRATFAGLSGADRSRKGKFFRFYRGEKFTVVLDRAARATGGRMVDANVTSLLDAFKEIRGCQ